MGTRENENKTIYLYLDTDIGEIKIPFLGLEEVDSFTVKYDNQDALINSIKYLLKLPISIDNVNFISLYDEFGLYNINKGTRFLPVKYKNDNFNLSSLKHAFYVYLHQNQQRLIRCDIKIIKNKAMMDLLDGILLNDYQLSNTVDSYWNKNEYRRYRYVYFLIKDFVPIKKEKVVNKSRTVSSHRNLSKFENEGNDYFQYLTGYASKGEDEYDKAMEELAMFDFDEIGDSLKHSHYGLFDGSMNDINVQPEHLTDLEECTGMDIEELMNYVSEFRGNGRKR